MKLSEVINRPDKTLFVPDDLEAIREMIQFECQTIFGAYDAGAATLWRGLKSPNEGHCAFFADTPTFRPPRSSTHKFQEFADDCLSSLGYHALRSNSIFATGSLDVAHTYGHPYAIFPQDGFSFTWSPQIADLYSDIFMGVKTDEMDDNPVFDLSPLDFVDEFQYTDRDLIEACNSGHEIFIHGRYLAIELDWFNDNAPLLFA